MSSIETTKCPKCGNEKTHHTGGWGFYGKETTTCPKCGNSYDNVPNCINDVNDYPDENNLNPVKQYIFDFSTEDLEKELAKRIEETKKKEITDLKTSEQDEEAKLLYEEILNNVASNVREFEIIFRVLDRHKWIFNERGWEIKKYDLKSNTTVIRKMEA